MQCNTKQCNAIQSNAIQSNAFAKYFMSNDNSSFISKVYLNANFMLIKVIILKRKNIGKSYCIVAPCTAAGIYR